MRSQEKKYFMFDSRFVLGLFLSLLIRLIPLRAPNIEPIMATTMPFGKYFGVFAGFSFAVLSILLYDIITHTLGMQTLFTAGAYGVVGLCSFYYFKQKEGTAMNYALFAIYATLFFDIITGLTTGPLFFHQSFLSALSGQIPFTILHLLGNITLALILSPAIHKMLYKKKKTENLSSIKILNPKTI